MRNLCVKPRTLALKISFFLWFNLHPFLPIPVNTSYYREGTWRGQVTLVPRVWLCPYVVPHRVVLHRGCVMQAHSRWPSQTCWVGSQGSATCSQKALMRSGKQKRTQHLSQGGWIWLLYKVCLNSRGWSHLWLPWQESSHKLLTDGSAWLKMLV